MINMQNDSLDQWQHSHDFNLDTAEGERRTLLVVMLTFVMMIVEIATGYLWGSMALLADGWHMGTHVAALGISVFAYRYARRHAGNPVYSFGTGKVSALGGFASAVALVIVALMMGAESIERLLSPRTIHFNEAITVAVIGLLVNLLSAWLLQGARGDAHGHHHPGDHQVDTHGHHHDHNLRAAYLHVLADALTSLLAVIALFAGKFFGWIWMDALMGLVGAFLITRWGLSLSRETSRMLLDGTPESSLLEEIRDAIESRDGNRIADLHVWRLGPKHYGAIVSLVTGEPKSPDHYKSLLAGISQLEHLTIEVNQAGGHA